MCAADAISVERVTAAVKQVARAPVIVKLSPNVTDIVEHSDGCREGWRRRHNRCEHAQGYGDRRGL